MSFTATGTSYLVCWFVRPNKHSHSYSEKYYGSIRSLIAWTLDPSWVPLAAFPTRTSSPSAVMATAMVMAMALAIMMAAEMAAAPYEQPTTAGP